MKFSGFGLVIQRFAEAIFQPGAGIENAGRASGGASHLTDETSISKWGRQKAVIVQVQPIKTGRCGVKITKSAEKVDKLSVLADVIPLVSDQ